MGFTGQLGTADSQLGKLVLGSSGGPGGITLEGIAPTSAVGSINVGYQIQLSGIAPTSAVGAISVAYQIQLTGIAPTSVVGTIDVTIVPVTLRPEGIAPTLVVGTITVTTGPVTVTLTGIAPTSIVGTISVIYAVQLTGIAPTSNVGVVTVTVGPVTVTLIGIAPTSAVGSINAIYVIQLTGIASTVAFGTIVVTRLAALYISVSVPTYRVVIADLDGNAIEEVPAKNLQISWALNEPGGCGFTIPLRHPKALRSLLDPGKREIHVIREGTRIWGGYLWFVGASSNDKTIRIAGEGYLSRLMRRHIDEDLIYDGGAGNPGIDQLQIAWNLINWTQNKIVNTVSGNLGIVRDNPAEASGVLRVAKFRAWERQKIGDIIQDLTETGDGFDIEITPTKRWKTFYPRKGVVTDHVFELGKNIGSIAYDIDAENTITEASALGSGDRKNRCIAVTYDIGALAEFGILQESESFSRIRSYPTLANKASTMLKKNKKARAQPQITVETQDPPFGAYDIGDRAQVRAEMGYISIDKQLTIASMLLQLSDAGHESIQLYFDEVLV